MIYTHEDLTERKTVGSKKKCGGGREQTSGRTEDKAAQKLTQYAGIKTEKKAPLPLIPQLMTHNRSLHNSPGI
jgi:hypothetical protein